MTPPEKLPQASISGEMNPKDTFQNMVSSELERLVGQLLDLTEKYEGSTSPQGKNLYGKKLKKVQTKVTRLARLAK